MVMQSSGHGIGSSISTGELEAGSVTSGKLSGDMEMPGMFGLGDPEEVTIASGVITVTKSFVRIETEGGASTDALTSISGGSQGDIIYLTAKDGSHDVVVTHGTPIRLAGGADFTMNGFKDKMKLIKLGGEWHEVSRSDN